MLNQITRPPSGDRIASSDPQRLLRIHHTCSHESTAASAADWPRHSPLPAECRML
ncbi:hypothetical protein [Oscillatoria acuminata]|uniref:hypothetical protein n=1 Tax=Oscillatoria acuminata TaxID=118323 RepID=UPI0002FE9F8B|nr:hypothetical protein [Oscillatoria acuminata]